MNINNNGEMIDVLIEDNTSKPTSYTKVGEFLAQDIFDILIEEKPGLNHYDTIKIIKIIEMYSKGVKYHQIHIYCTHAGFMVTGSENIEDLPQKVRQIKLEKILNE